MFTMLCSVHGLTMKVHSTSPQVVAHDVILLDLTDSLLVLLTKLGDYDGGGESYQHQSQEHRKRSYYLGIHDIKYLRSVVITVLEF